MNKLVRYWNQNRGKIIMALAIIAFIIILIQAVKDVLKNQEDERELVSKVEHTKPIQSVITGQVISEETTDANMATVKQFVDYCNNKNYNEAFNMLSEDCKNEFENEINNFINNFYNNVFSTKRTYKLELMFKKSNMYTYKITYYENNLLATGGSELNKNVEDYITVFKDDNESKISINGFITKEEINESQKIGDIEVIVNSKKVYRTYETYNITIKNYSGKRILINNSEKPDDICLVDQNGEEYASFINEIPVELLSLATGYQKNLDIKFNKGLNLYRTIEKVKFKNIILDYDAYYQNKETEKVDISVNI